MFSQESAHVFSSKRIFERNDTIADKSLSEIVDIMERNACVKHFSEL